MDVMDVMDVMRMEGGVIGVNDELGDGVVSACSANIPM